MLMVQIKRTEWDRLVDLVGKLRTSGYKELRNNANALYVEWSGILPSIVSVPPHKKRRKLKARFTLCSDLAKFYHELYTYYCIKAANGYAHGMVSQYKSPLLRMLVTVAGALGAGYDPSTGELMSRTLLINTVMAKAKMTRAEVEQEFSVLGPPPIEEDTDDDDILDEDDD